VLDRARPRRTFRRLNGTSLASVLGVPDDEDQAAGAPDAPSGQD
jgi:hypothetical protein